MTLRTWRPNPEAVRFVPFFVGINLIGGVHLPFFPTWLASVGFDPQAIGILMASMGMLRVFTGPALGVIADAYGARRQAIILLMIVAALSYVGYELAATAGLVILFSLTSSAAFSAIGPLLEGITLKTAMHRGFDYGRVRMWGSAAFIVMNFLGGWLIATNGIAAFLPTVIAAGTFSVIAAFALPHEHERPHRDAAGSIWRDARRLARHPLFWLFIAGAGLAQSCHAFYYAFGTLNWKALHYDARTIGILWAIGVIAEIVLLSYSSRAVAKIGPMRLLAIGAACGVVRWTALAFSPPLWLLIPIQCLHAGTFCAVHLGTMHFISRATPPHLVGTAQSIFAAVCIGIFMAAGQFGSGFLFAHHGSYGYLAMTVQSVVALGLVLWLARAWKGGTLELAR